MSKQKDLREISYEIANAERRIQVEQAYILKMREIRKGVIKQDKKLHGKEADETGVDKSDMC